MSDAAVSGSTGGRRRWHPSRARTMATASLVLVTGVVLALVVPRISGPTSDPAADVGSVPVASDGTSVFTPTGFDRVIRERRLTISLRDDRRPAEDLGLPTDESTTLSLPVAVSVTLLSPSGALVWDHVDDIEIITRHGRIDEVGIAIPLGAERERIEQLTDQFGWPANTGTVFTAELDQVAHDPFFYTRVLGLLRVEGLWAHLLAKGGGDEPARVRVVLAAEESATEPTPADIFTVMNGG